MPAISFVGRTAELHGLNLLWNKKTASLVVMNGRRRIGKSALAERFAKGKKFYSFSGLPPDEHTTAQSERDEFANQLAQALDLPGVTSTDWSDLLTLLAKQTQKGKIVILLDEISWMGSKDPDFLGKLKIAWDLYFSKNPQLILILCGSVSAWIEKNILSSTAFFGRITLKITLNEFSLKESATLLDALGFRGSVFEKFIILSITGGIPWYLTLINPALSATENIKKLCFEPNGILVDEFRHIFHDLFGKRGSFYKKIVEILAIGTASQKEIAHTLKYSHSGALSDYLDELVMAGFISRDFTGVLTSKQESKLSQYRLSDNYLRFYLKCMRPRLSKIKKGQLKTIALLNLPGLESVLGFQFENLVLSNRFLVYEALGIRPEEIVFDNPFFQRPNTKQAGCQIDYLIQTCLGTLYICEIKFSRNEIKTQVIEETKQKIKALKHPKGLACVPVLIYVGDVSPLIVEADYFGRIINFGDLMHST